MEKIIEGLLSWILRIVKAPARIVPVAAIVLTSFIYIVFGEKSYVSIPDNDMDIELQTFQKCEITFKSPVYISSYGISKGRNSEHARSGLTSITSTDVRNKQDFLMITNTDPDPASAYTVQVFFSSSSGCDIEKVAVDNTEISLKSFFSHDLKSENAQLVRFRYVRNDIAKILTAFNDVVSNWILTILFVGIVVLSIEAGTMEYRASLFFSEQQFKQFLIKSLRIGDFSNHKDREDAFAVYAAKWYKVNVRLRFLQALGPAIGFILTVSSLIAALEPSLAAANSIDAFITGIHVAMVSTFLGLLLRILSLEASRVNDILLSRAEHLLTDSGKYLLAESGK